MGVTAEVDVEGRVGDNVRFAPKSGHSSKAKVMSAWYQQAVFRTCPPLSCQRVSTEMLVSAGSAAAPLRYANKVATKPQAAANISHSPATARLSVAWIK